MKIVEYFTSGEESRANLLSGLRRCDWRAGQFLLKLLEDGTFTKTLGGEGKLFFLLDSSCFSR